jgi:hypothetical protein
LWRGSEEIIAILAAGRDVVVLFEQIIPHNIVDFGSRFTLTAGHGRFLATLRSVAASSPADRMKPIGDLLNVCLFSGLVYFSLYLFDLGEDFPLVAFGVKNVPLDCLYLFDLFLQYLFLRPQFRLIGPEYLQSVGLQFCRSSDAVFQHEKFFGDAFDFVLDLIDLSIHHLEDIFESCDFFIFLSFLGLCLQFEVVLLFEDDIDFHCASFLCKGILVKFYLAFHLFVFHF